MPIHFCVCCVCARAPRNTLVLCACVSQQGVWVCVRVRVLRLAEQCCCESPTNNIGILNRDHRLDLTRDSVDHESYELLEFQRVDKSIVIAPASST